MTAEPTTITGNTLPAGLSILDKNTDTHHIDYSASAAAHALEEARPATIPQETIAFAQKFFDMARRGSMELLAYLEAGLPPDLTNSSGDTLLMLASYHGRVALVQELLHPSTASSKTTLKRKSANPNVLNDRMQSCLAGAIFKDETEIIKLLLAAGANPDIGKPTADETAKLFGKDLVWGSAFAEARVASKARNEILICDKSGVCGLGM